MIYAIIKKRFNIDYAHLSWDIFTIAAITILAYLFYTIVADQLSKKIILFSSAILVIYFITKLLFTRSGNTFNSINVALIAIVVIVYSISYFYEQLTKPADGSQFFLYNTPSFWIVTAYLIYFAGTFFLYIYSQNKNFTTDTEFAAQYGIINSVFTFLKNILLSVAMFVTVEDSKKPVKHRTQTY